MEVVECGAAALSIVLGYYSRFVSLEELREKCGVSRDGVNAHDIVEAAEWYGLKGEGYEVDIDHLHELKLPAILFWDYNHFVVLEGFSGDKVYINDPATGPRQITRDDLKEHHSDVALEFTPTPSFEKGGNYPSLWQGIKQRMLPYKKAMGILLVFQTCLVALGLVMPLAYQYFLDDILGKQDLTWKWPYLGTLTGLMIGGTLLTWSQGMFLNRLMVQLSKNFSGEFLWHVLQLPINFFMQRFGGEIIQRMRLNNQVAQMLTGQLVISAISLVLVISYGFIMFQYDVLISLIGVGAGLFNLTMLLIISRIRTNAYARVQQEQAKITGVSLDTIENIETMKATGHDAHFFSKISGYCTKNINAMQQIGRSDIWLSTLASAAQQISTILLLGIGVWRVMAGSLSVGMLIALQLILSRFLAPIGQLVSFGTQLHSLQVDLSRLDDVLKNKKDPLVTHRKQHDSEQINHKGHLQIENISFGYYSLQPPYIANFSLDIPPGKWVALVGAVGSGKSTIAKLAAGLYQPRSGALLYDGKEITDTSREEMKRFLTHVDQEIILFEGTIFDNITLWDPTVPESQVIAAAKEACIHDEIMLRNHGYQTKLSEDGRNLSQGQRQRIELARALLHRPKLLVLDEATSALDSDTEANIIASLRKRGCSCLMVAHRLSTIRDCDEILVLEKGHIVQRGTHQQLKEQPGLYRGLLDHG